MARGRPRLDPIVKQHNNREARRRYEEKRRAAIANLNIYERAKHRRRVAEDSENYRFRKKQADQDEMLAEQLATKQARRTDAKALRKKHKPAPPAANLARRPTPSPTPEPPFVALPRRPLEQCPHCLDCCCIGCACMCPDSIEWFTHDGGHFYPTCKLSNLSLLLSRISSPMAILLCTPIYAPDRGHEDPWKFAGPFYAVVHSDWKGAVTSPESLEKMCRAYPGASVWKAQLWLVFLRMWTLDCTEYHAHPEGEVAQDPPPPSEVLEKALQHTLRPSPPPTPRPPPPYSPPATSRPAPSTPKKAPTPSSSSSSSKLNREELDELAYMRPHAGPISPRRLNQQFARALGAQAVVEATPPVSSTPTPRPASSASPRPPTSPSRRPRSSQPARTIAHPVSALARASTPPSARMMYAVSGHNRLFGDRGRAMKVLKGSPDADLAFSQDEEEVFDFLVEETARMKM
ncbi:hypothetical protein DFH09DRAFT_1323594 [Mycena vulgaris]|nr:hypothetical protein DFH09DRAFT_1323594 [Mycena vulgaris]